MEPDFFPRYDALGAESASLDGVEASLSRASAALGKERGDLEHEKSLLLKNESYTREQKERIELVSNHWFYGTTALQPQLWLRGGAQGKIDRAKAKLDVCERTESS